jgi:hypothetical protein
MQAVAFFDRLRLGENCQIENEWPLSREGVTAVRLFRIRIRTLMMIIALDGVFIAGAMGIVRWPRLQSEYQAKAAYHASQAAGFQRQMALAQQASADAKQAASDLDRFAGTASEASKAHRAQTREYIAKVTSIVRARYGYQRLADYHAGLARKYTEAIKHPWRALSPDPPEEEDPTGVSLLLGYPEAPALPRDL